MDNILNEHAFQLIAENNYQSLFSFLKDNSKHINPLYVNNRGDFLVNALLRLNQTNFYQFIDVDLDYSQAAKTSFERSDISVLHRLLSLLSKEKSDKIKFDLLTMCYPKHTHNIYSPEFTQGATSFLNNALISDFIYENTKEILLFLSNKNINLLVYPTEINQAILPSLEQSSLCHWLKDNIKIISSDPTNIYNNFKFFITKDYINQENIGDLLEQIHDTNKLSILSYRISAESIASLELHFLEKIKTNNSFTGKPKI